MVRKENRRCPHAEATATAYQGLSTTSTSRVPIRMLKFLCLSVDSETKQAPKRESENNGVERA